MIQKCYKYKGNFFLVQEGKEGLEGKAMFSLVALPFSFLTGIPHLLVIQRKLKDEWIIHSLNGTRRELPYSNNLTEVSVWQKFQFWVVLRFLCYVFVTAALLTLGDKGNKGNINVRCWSFWGCWGNLMLCGNTSASCVTKERWDMC